MGNLQTMMRSSLDELLLRRRTNPAVKIPPMIVLNGVRQLYCMDRYETAIEQRLSTTDVVIINDVEETTK